MSERIDKVRKILSEAVPGNDNFKKEKKETTQDNSINIGNYQISINKSLPFVSILAIVAAVLVFFSYSFHLG